MDRVFGIALEAGLTIEFIPLTNKGLGEGK